MSASYPMYALPQVQKSLVTWWQQVLVELNKNQVAYHQKLKKVETDLYRHWLDPELFFSQTCGYPLTTVLKDRVKLIGTPVYDSSYSQQANYCSLLIVGSGDNGDTIEDYSGKRFAFNGLDSQSGFNAVKMYLTERSLPVPFFGQNLQSGQHIKSIAMVSLGEADICAVDSISYSHIQRHQPRLLANVRVLDSTGFTPGLPFITSVNIYDAIEHVCNLDALCQENSDLLIKGVNEISLDSYMQSINPVTPQVTKL
jgi:hypothetical protein